MLSSLWFRKAKGMFVCEQHRYILSVTSVLIYLNCLPCLGMQSCTLSLVLWNALLKELISLTFLTNTPKQLNSAQSFKQSVTLYLWHEGIELLLFSGYTEMSQSNGWGTGRGIFCCARVGLDDCCQRNDKFLSLKKTSIEKPCYGT